MHAPVLVLLSRFLPPLPSRFCEGGFTIQDSEKCASIALPFLVDLVTDFVPNQVVTHAFFFFFKKKEDFKNILDKIMYQNYLHLIANFCVTVSNILPKEIISNNTKHLKQISKFH